jgi:uncharacterized protein
MVETDAPLKTVFDCNVFLQAAASANGPAAACLNLARNGRISLVVSLPILAELKDVASRPKVAAQLALTEAIVNALIEDVMTYAHVLPDVPSIFVHPIDPKDSVYVNVAVAAGATIITTRDLHLLNLTDPTRPESTEFRSRFPGLEVLTPVQLLSRVRSV